MIENAKERVDEILRKPKEKRLDPLINKELKEYFKVISARTLQDYQKLEGIEDNNSKINIGGIDIN